MGYEHPYLKQYVRDCKKGKYSIPTCNSFKILADAVLDPMFIVKAQTFISIAELVEPYLAKFQSDAPMVPYLCEELTALLISILERFVKKDVVETLKCPAQIVKLNIEDASLYRETRGVQVGFLAKQELLNLKGKGSVSDAKIYGFKSDARKFMVAICKKMLDKCPLKYSLIQNLQWLSPTWASDSSSQKALEKTLTTLVDAGTCRVNEHTSDLILQQFSCFVCES